MSKRGPIQRGAPAKKLQMERDSKRRRLLPPQATGVQPDGQQGCSVGEEDVLDLDIPSDVLAALVFLRNDLFGAQQALLPPLLLKSHIYTVLADRTDVDRDLDELQRKGSVRLFKLTSGVDEYAIMLASDYTELIHKLIQAAQTANGSQQHEIHYNNSSSSSSIVRTGSAGQTSSPAHGMRAFITHVVPACADIKVQGGVLTQLLSKPLATCQLPAARPGDNPGRPTATSSCGRRNADAAVSQLLSAGLLLRDAVSSDAYLFTVPKAGLIVKALVNGRKELTSLLSKKRYKEAPEKELLTKQKLRGSTLSMKYHVRDLLGRGVAERVTTPTGPFIKLINR